MVIKCRLPYDLLSLANTYVEFSVAQHVSAAFSWNPLRQADDFSESGSMQKKTRRPAYQPDGASIRPVSVTAMRDIRAGYRLPRLGVPLRHPP